VFAVTKIYVACRCILAALGQMLGWVGPSRCFLVLAVRKHLLLAIHGSGLSTGSIFFYINYITLNSTIVFDE
jgi:hypothetical protein